MVIAKLIGGPFDGETCELENAIYLEPEIRLRSKIKDFAAYEKMAKSRSYPLSFEKVAYGIAVYRILGKDRYGYVRTEAQK